MTMPNYHRSLVAGGTYFFTVNLLERNKSLLIDHIDSLKLAIKITHQNQPFHIDAWVILPEHMHCIWTLPNNDTDYSNRWKSIKIAFSKSIPKDERLSQTRIRRNERGIWQRRFWEHTIRNEEDYKRHMDYIHFNPVKHGYVNQVKDWPHSTFHRLVKADVYDKNWGIDIALNTGERK